MPDIVIAGGGIIGCATAYYLAREGAAVTVIERGDVGGESSGAAAGMLAALSGEGGERGAEFDALLSSSLAAYTPLIPELAGTGVDIRYTRTGVMHIALTPDEAGAIRHRYERVRAEGAAAVWFDGPAAILKEEANANPRAIAAYVTPNEAYVDPQRITQALAEAARSQGATVVSGAAVTRLGRRGVRVTSVSTADATYHADHVLLAAGPWTAVLAGRLGGRVPVRPVRGQMLSLEGPETPLRHMVWGTHAYLLPREEGQTYVGATVEEVGYRKRTTSESLSRLRRGAASLAPSLAAAKQRRAWAGLRPASPDGLPIMGQLPGWQNVWVSTGHFRNGIPLAPGCGELVAKSILAGTPDPVLQPFSPARFLD